MNSYRTPFYLVTVFFVAAIVFIVVQQNTIKRLANELAALRAEAGQANQLRAENVALANDLKAIEERSAAERRELLRLRGQAPALHDKDQEIARLKADRERMTQQLQTSAPPPADQTAPEQTAERRRAIARISFSKQLGLSLLMFAADHQEQFPADLDAIDTKRLSAMPESVAHNIQGDQFELVYKGRLDGVQDPSRTVLAREREPVQRTDGKWEQSYVFVDGHAELLSAPSREELAKREKEQFILPANP